MSWHYDGSDSWPDLPSLDDRDEEDGSIEGGTGKSRVPSDLDSQLNAQRIAGCEVGEDFDEEAA